MKRVSFFLPSLSFGGIEANTIRLVQSLQNSGYKVDLVIGKEGGEYEKRIGEDVNTIFLKQKSLMGMLLPLIRYVKENKPDVLITGGEGANILLAIVKMLLPKTKVIISIRTNLSTEYKETKNKKKSIIFPILSRLLYKKVDRIVTVSKGVAKDASNFLGFPINRFEVIYNPIVNNELIELMNDKVNHEWLNDQNVPVIVSVGRIVKQKDFPLLIKAFIHAKKMNGKLKLIIIGDGPDKLHIEEEIRKSDIQSDVDMMGFIQNPYPYMKKADVFVLSSKWEGFGNVLVEALSTGVPVVSTDCPSGPSEILDNGQFGTLIEVGDEKELAKAIITTMNNNNIIDVKKRKSRAIEFSVENAKEKYITLINSL